MALLQVLSQCSFAFQSRTPVPGTKCAQMAGFQIVLQAKAKRKEEELNASRKEVLEQGLGVVSWRIGKSIRAWSKKICKWFRRQSPKAQQSLTFPRMNSDPSWFVVERFHPMVCKQQERVVLASFVH